MKINRILKRIIPPALLMSFALLMACDQSDNSRTDSIVNPTSTVKILKKKFASFNKYFSTSQLITTTGGVVQLGDSESGYCQLDFPSGAINNTDYPNGVQIAFSWESEDLLSGEFGPHGIIFDEPVHMHLSYMDADLTGININTLKIYWLNDVTNQYELVPSTVDTIGQYVEADLLHFSRYAIGTDN